MKWFLARRKCLAIVAKHDRVAEAGYNNFSCGYCHTEDCSCSGYSRECDCGFCTDVFNKENNTGYEKRTWKELLDWWKEANN